MNQTVNLLFFLKKSKQKADGTVPIYARETIDGERKEISSKRYILPESWDSKSQKVSNRTLEAKALNAYLKTFEQEIYEAHHQLMKDKKAVTSWLDIFKNVLLANERWNLTESPIIIGNEHSKLELTMITSPFYSYYKAAHYLLEKILVPQRSDALKNHMNADIENLDEDKKAICRNMMGTYIHKGQEAYLRVLHE